MSVGNICVRNVDTVSPDDSAQLAAGRMHDHKVGTLVVQNTEGRPVGIITDRDLAIRVIAPGLDVTTTDVADVMTSTPETVTEDTPIESALRLMRSGPYRRLPVVDSHGTLVGLISLDDMLKHLVDEFDQITELLQEESPDSLAKE